MKKLLLYSFFTFSLFNYSQTELTMQDGYFEACDAFFRDSGGSAPYSNNENYTMTICPETEGDFIRLSFDIATGFITDSTSDILTIYNGDSTDAPIQGTYSLGNGPGLINAYNPSGCLTFNFVSDASGTSFGWSADMICISNFIINQPTNYELCSENNSTAAEYDLESKTPEILGNLDPNEYVVTYHESYDAAEENVNAFISPYTNYLNPQIIFTRVTEVSSGDYNIASFYLILNGVDIQPQVYEAIACDEGESDGFSTFDLTLYEDIFTNGNPNISLSYFESFEDAFANVNAITNPTAYINTTPYFQAVMIRYEDVTTGCSLVSGNSGFLYLNVEDSISINEPTPYVVCDDDDDGFFTFNLNTKIDEIVNGIDNQNLFISFHETQADADANVNALDSVYTNNTAFIQTLYVRVSSGLVDCYQNTTLDLVVTTDCVSASSVDVIVCAEDPNIPVDYDLTSQEANMVNGQNPSDFTFAYYYAITNAETETDPITNPDVYSVSGNSSVVHVRIEDNISGNSIIVQIFVNFNLNPQIDFNGPFTICSGNEIILFPFINNDNGTYDYLWSTGETDQEIIVNTGGTYSVTVTDLNTGCTSTASVEVIEGGDAPALGDAADLSSCEPNVTFDLTTTLTEILNGLDPSQFMISFFNDANSAYTNTNPITNEVNYTPLNATETIYVRVQNSGDDCFEVSDFIITSDNSCRLYTTYN